MVNVTIYSSTMDPMGIGFKHTSWDSNHKIATNIWAAEIKNGTQLTGCSYLVLQSSHIFWGSDLVLHAALVLIAKRFTCDAYLVLGCSPGVPTSFYSLDMMCLTNWGTPQYLIKQKYFIKFINGFRPLLI